MPHWIIGLALVGGLAIAECAQAVEPTMKYPRCWEHYQKLFAQYHDYFECDYISRTCLRGKAAGSTIVGEVLADDRVTVLAHVIVKGEMVINFDTGGASVTMPSGHHYDQPGLAAQLCENLETAKPPESDQAPPSAEKRRDSERWLNDALRQKAE
jgi:hypothetical protein